MFENILKQYGEYDIPYEIAKEKGILKVNYALELSDILKGIKDNYNFNSYVLLQLDLGNYCAELSYLGEKDIAIVFVAKLKETGWQNDDCSEILINENFFKQDKKEIEKIIYDDMIKNMQKSNWYWSKEN